MSSVQEGGVQSMYIQIGTTYMEGKKSGQVSCDKVLAPSLKFTHKNEPKESSVDMPKPWEDAGQ